MLPRTVQALRRPLAAASSSRAALPAIRRYASETPAPTPKLELNQSAFVFEGPPPPKVESNAILKTYTGKGFPHTPVSESGECRLSLFISFLSAVYCHRRC